MTFSAIFQHSVAAQYRMRPMTWLHDKRKNGFVSTASRVLGFLPGIAYALLLDLSKVRSESHPIPFAITAIIKNEAPYILEWIEYHRLIGVTRFYLYDNESTDNLRDVIEPLIADGTVIYERISGKERQLDAYNKMLSDHGNECDFCAFIDADEFLFFGELNPLDYLKTNLSQSVGGLCLNWIVFGSSHRTEKPEGLVLENYLQRGASDFEANRHVKTICRPSTVIGFINPHYCRYRYGYHAEDTRGASMSYGHTAPLGEVPIPHIKHYFSKSLEEYLKKRSRGCADGHAMRDLDDFYRHDVNDVYDDSMLPYARAVQKRLAPNSHH